MKTNPILLGMMLLANVASAADGYWLTLFDKFQTAEVFLNGYPFANASGTNAFTTTSFLAPYVFTGENVVVIRSTDPATNAASLEAKIIRLTLDYGNDAIADRQPIGTVERQYYLVETNSAESIRFTSTNADVQVRGRLAYGATRFEITRETRTYTYRVLTSAPPHQIEIRATCALAPLSSLPWMGQPVTLTAQDKTDITNLVQSIYSALTNRDYPAYFQLVQTKNQRLAQSVGQTLQERQTSAQQFFENLRSQPGFAFVPLNVDALVFRSYSDANLVQVLAVDAPPIQATASEMRFKLPIFVSKIGGVWVCVD